MHKNFRHDITLFIIICLALFHTHCRDTNVYVAPPPPKVTAAHPLKQEIVTYREFPGRTEAVKSVEVRARVRGFLKSREFKEGDQVEAGTLLYTIEPEEYETTLKAAQARKAKAQAERQRTDEDFKRIKDLYDQEAAARMELINAQSSFEQAKAEILAAEAAIARAELDLSYTKILAPIAGKVNRTEVNVGNLVGQSEPTLLTTIIPWNPIYVYVSISERDVLDWRKISTTQAAESDRRLYLRLADGSLYPLPGKVDYIDNRIDPQTGTLRIRAIFDNPDNILVPGFFVRVRAPSEPRQAILVPEVAVQRDPTGYFVLIVNENGIADRVAVEVGHVVEQYREITSGLDLNQKMIVKGLQRVRPGVKVEAEMVKLTPLKSSAIIESRPSVESQPAEPER